MVIYTFSIEISTGSEINEVLYDGVGMSLGTLVGGLIVDCLRKNVNSLTHTTIML